MVLRLIPSGGRERRRCFVMNRYRSGLEVQLQLQFDSRGLRRVKHAGQASVEIANATAELWASGFSFESDRRWRAQGRAL